MNITKLSSFCLLAYGLLLACNAELPSSLDLRKPGDTDPSGSVGDADGDDDPTNDGKYGGGIYSAGEENTFSHMDDLSQDGSADPFEVLKQREEEGPPEVRSRLHSCQKIQYAALGSLLASLGVDMDASGNPDPAGELYRNGGDAMGAANYNSRTGEAITWTNSGATKMQDIFVQAAPEIIAALPGVEHCQIDGEGPSMFAEDNSCVRDAISCLIGQPATNDHVAICDHAVANASDIETGKNIAVASLLAGAHSCE